MLLTRVREALRSHRLALFLVVTYGVTWGAWIPLARAGRHVTAGFEPRYLLGMLGPLVGALVTTAVTQGPHGLRDLASRIVRVRVGLRWWGVALGLPIAAYALTYVVLVGYSMLMFAPVALPTHPTHLDGFPITNIAALFVLVVAINGFGEETGWRGVLLPMLRKRHSPLAASLAVAGVWAAWHAPLFLISDTFRALPLAMLPMWLLSLAAGSIFLTWLYNRGHHSVALVAVFHDVFNLVSVGPVAALESACVMIVAAVLVIRELRAQVRHRLGRFSEPVLA